MCIRDSILSSPESSVILTFLQKAVHRKIGSTIQHILPIFCFVTLVCEDDGCISWMAFGRKEKGSMTKVWKYWGDFLYSKFRKVQCAWCTMVLDGDTALLCRTGQMKRAEDKGLGPWLDATGVGHGYPLGHLVAIHRSTRAFDKEVKAKIDCNSLAIQTRLERRIWK